VIELFCAVYTCGPESFQVSDILCKMVSNCMIEEPNYYAVHNASIAHDDEQIEAHKICLRKQSKCGLWHPATDSGILLQIQASCYRFRHLLQIQTLATDSGTCYRFRHLLQIQAFCYRFRQSTTESCNLLQSHAICYRVMQSATELCNLLQSHAICYRVRQSATGSGNLLHGHAICDRNYIYAMHFSVLVL
jgi:hypothetical protein